MVSHVSGLCGGVSGAWCHVTSTQCTHVVPAASQTMCSGV